MATAIFDLDRTVTRLGTWTRFVFFANGLHPAFLLRLPLWLVRGIAGQMGLASGQSYKVYSLVLLARLPADQLAAKARAFVAREVVRGLRPGAQDAIRHHLARGDRLILATACVDLLGLPFGEALGFHTVVATRMMPSPDPRYLNPRMSGPNCYGAEKLRRVEECRPFPAPIFAYSDHISDLALLQRADHGFAVNPSRKLRKAAAAANLPIVDFNAPLPSLAALPK